MECQQKLCPDLMINPVSHPLHPCLSIFQSSNLPLNSHRRQVLLLSNDARGRLHDFPIESQASDPMPRCIRLFEAFDILGSGNGIFISRWWANDAKVWGFDSSFNHSIIFVEKYLEIPEPLFLPLTCDIIFYASRGHCRHLLLTTIYFGTPYTYFHDGPSDHKSAMSKKEERNACRSWQHFMATSILGPWNILVCHKNSEYFCM